jgi:ligand-binding SRPBCC domain-containing protein
MLTVDAARKETAVAKMQRIHRVSQVDAPIEDVWAAITSPEGINYELSPYLRMTVPARFKGATIAGLEPGTHLGRSYLLLFGVLPIDYDDITLAEIDQGTRFREQSTMMSMQSWVHERTLRRVGDRTEVSDAVSFVPRAPMRFIPGWSWLVAAFIGFLFRHRHRRLERAFQRSLEGQGSTRSLASGR